MGITLNLQEQVVRDFNDLWRISYTNRSTYLAKILSDIVLTVRFDGQWWWLDYRVERETSEHVPAEAWRSWFRCRDRDACIAKAVEAYLKGHCKEIRYDETAGPDHGHTGASG